MIGEIIGNRYEIIEKLGGGGMSVVYKAHDKKLNRIVTIKYLRPEYAADKEFLERFHNEAQAVARLSHPNIVNIYDIGYEDGNTYLVMEYIEGKNLKQVIRQKKVIGQRQAIIIARQVAEALSHAHEQGIVHRDIKPHNIMVTNQGVAKITDFGIARTITGDTITQSDNIVGSVHYISPEQAKGAPGGPSSDIYSLGIVLYEMITGTLPFTGETPVAVALKQIKEECVPPSKVNPSIVPQLETVVMHMLEKDIARRYQSAADVVHDLNSVLSGKADLIAAVNNSEDDFATRIMPKPDLKNGSGNGSNAVRSGSAVTNNNGKTVTGNASAAENKTNNKQYEDSQYDIPPKKRIGLFFLILGLMIALLGAGAYIYSNYFQVKDTPVPYVITLEEQQAIEKITNNNLQYKIKTEYNNDIEKDHVFNQEPEAGTIVKEGETVTIYVSLGAEQVNVPGVIGKSEEKARAILTEAGFAIGDVSEEYSDSIDEGCVAEQNPDAGDKRDRGAEIDLVISKGPAPVIVVVGNYIGETLDAVKTKIQELKLKLNEDISYEENDEYPEGYVINQFPTSGSEVEEGTEITLVVSKGAHTNSTVIEYTVPQASDNAGEEGKTHNVEFVKSDADGDSSLLQGEYAEGETVSCTVEYSKDCQIIIYLDGNAADTRNLTYN